MSEPIRAKMHIWGPNRTQKVIFVDELEAYEEKGWRDHPNKVGKPVERSLFQPVQPLNHDEAPKKRGRPKAVSQDDKI